MLKRTKSCALLSLGIFHMTFGPSPLTANEENSEFPCCEASIVVREPLNPCLLNAGYPYPATINPSCGWDIYASGDFLYLATDVDVVSYLAIESTFDNRTSVNLFQGSPYRPGFRVAVGVDLGPVVLDVTYLRYHSRTTSNFQSANNSETILTLAAPDIVNAFAAPVAFGNVRSRRSFDLDSFIISLQKPVYIGKRICMNLNYGILGLWNGVKWNINCLAVTNPPPGMLTSNGSIFSNHKTWAVGPNLGVTAKGLLPWGFQGIVGIDLAIQYASVYKGFQRTSFPMAVDPATGIPFIQDNNAVKSKGNIPHFQAAHGGDIGIGWGGYFVCNKYHLDLSLTYNFIYQHIFDFGHALFNQVGDGMLQVSYGMHGISVGGRLDF